jgi:hypothetical protein
MQLPELNLQSNRFNFQSSQPGYAKPNRDKSKDKSGTQIQSEALVKTNQKNSDKSHHFS